MQQDIKKNVGTTGAKDLGSENIAGQEKEQRLGKDIKGEQKEFQKDIAGAQKPGQVQEPALAGEKKK